MRSFTAATPQQLSALLRSFRQERRLTQAALAQQIALPQKVVSMAENHPEKMGVQRLFDLLSALGVELVLRSRQPVQAAKTEW